MAFAFRSDVLPDVGSGALAAVDITALIDAFAGLDAEVVRDVARQCEGVKDAIALLRGLCPERPPVAHDVAHGHAFGDVLPDDVRDVIFKSLSARDAAVLACTCKEFRALVASWRRDARRIAPPANARARTTIETFASDVVRLGGMIRAYPNVSAVSFRKMGETLKPPADSAEDDWERLSNVLTAVAANNASQSIESIDFEGCGEWLSEYGVVAIAERCREIFPALTSIAWTRARALRSSGLSRALAPYGDTLRELKLVGCVSLDEKAIYGALDVARCLRVLDVTGCSGVKRLVLGAHVATRLERLKAVNCKSMTNFSIRRTSDSSALNAVNVADCGSLRELQVQSGSVETISAAGCKALETFNAYAPKCETLLMNKCASLRAVTEEMNTVRSKLPAVKTLKLDSCKVLTSSGFADILNMCGGSLVELSAEGCFSIERAFISSPHLVRCALSGCPALQVARISSANCREFVARACKTLTEVRFESGTYDLGTFDVRNSGTLKRVVGVRRHRVRNLDVDGCGSSLEFI